MISYARIPFPVWIQVNPSQTARPSSFLPVHAWHIGWLFFKSVYVHLQKTANTALFYHGKIFRAKAKIQSSLHSILKTNKNTAIILYLPDDVLGPPI